MDSPNLKIERKLAEYRSKREREKFIEKSKQALKSMLNFRARDNNNSLPESKSIEKDEAEKLLPEHDTSDIQSVTSDFDDNINCCSFSDLIYYFLWFILWATVYAIFIKLQFGMVYLISSALIGIYLNTRTRPKNVNEVSAYSVFNKNCESIDGTLKAEQFERELRYGRPILHV